MIWLHAAIIGWVLGMIMGAVFGVIIVKHASSE